MEAKTWQNTVMPLEYSALDGLHCAGISDKKILRALNAQAERTESMLKDQWKQEGWELQDKLLAMTVLNQNAPKIVLTNDECGWNITYYPDAPYTRDSFSLMKGDPLEAVKTLWEVIHGS